MTDRRRDALHVAVAFPRLLLAEGLAAALLRHPDVGRVSLVATDATTLDEPDLVDVLVVHLDDADRAWRLLEGPLPPGLRIVAVHRGLEVADARRALFHGVRALVPEDAGLRGVLEALLPSPWAARAVRPAPSAPPALDDVERRVLHALSLGNTSRRAAAALGLTLHQFDEVKRRIFAKLGVGHQAHAVATALRRGLLDDGQPEQDVPTTVST